ncbi:MAG: hypothetical protein COB42_05810 [Sulfurimonas sp.]|nr:MAG: hypothetical protein COB42_05810 [Sulfurimonas sp.]
MKALSFSGSASEYFKIWIVNIVLTIITLGVYYPWAKVRNKRYFYANTSLEDRNFEYHATGRQLLVGYLIAMVFLILYIVLQKISPVASLGVIVVFLLALPWIILRSMVFNMKMTSFSNVHFEFIGSVGSSYITYLATPIVMYISMGLIYGFIAYLSSLEFAYSSFINSIFLLSAFAFTLYAFAFIKKVSTTFILNNTKYGNSQFEVDVNTKNFMLISLKTTAIAIFLFMMSFILVGTFGYLIFGLEYFANLLSSIQYPGALNSEESSANNEGLAASIIQIVGLIYIVILFASIFIMAYKISKERSYIFENTILDEKVKFASTLEALPFGWLLFSNLILIIITLGFATPWAKVRAARYIMTNTLIEAKDGLDVFITQKTEEESSLGEQIGDAFDVDVGIGI